MRPPQAAKSVVVWGHLLFASVHMSVRACLQTLLKDTSPISDGAMLCGMSVLAASQPVTSCCRLHLGDCKEAGS